MDVGFIQETQSPEGQTIKIPGYQIEYKARRTGRRRGLPIKGGGVMTLIREKLSYAMYDKRLLAPDDHT